MAEVVISVRSELDRIIGDMKKLQSQASQVGDGLSKSTESIGKSVKDQGNGVSNFLKSLQDLGRRTADQLRGDFKTLFNLEALKGGLKLGTVFEDAVKGAVEVANTVRRLGPVFGMVESQFASFQTKLVKGLGSIGLGAEVAARALEGLSHTQVRGENNLIEYSKNAGMLASIGGEKGGEGKIAEGLADAIRSQGKDENSPAALADTIAAVRHTMNATGQSATSALGMMNSAYGGMSNESKHRMTPEGLGRLAAVSAEVGDISHLASSSMSGRFHDSNLVKGASGFNGLIGPNGVNFEVLDKMKKVVNRLPGDKIAALGTAGFDDQSAREALNIIDLESKAKKKQAEFGKEGGTTESQYESGRGLGETGKGAVNKTMALFAGPMAKVTEEVTSLLQAATKTTAGAAVTTGAGVLMTAMLTGGGVKGLAESVMGGAKSVIGAQALEKATGEHVQLVAVTNWPVGGILGGPPGTDPSSLFDKAKKLLPVIATGGAVIGGAVGAMVLANHFIAEPDRERRKADIVANAANSAAAEEAARGAVNKTNEGGERSPEDRAALEKELRENNGHLRTIAANTGKSAAHAKAAATPKFKPHHASVGSSQTP